MANGGATPSRWVGAVLGVVSAGAGLAVAELTSALLNQRASPLIALSEVIIRLTPGRVAEFLISIVGQNDKPILVASTFVGVLVVGAVVGLVALRRLVVAQIAFIGLGVLVLVAVNARLPSSTLTYVPAVLGTVVTLVVLGVLAPRAATGADSEWRPADGGDSARPGESGRSQPALAAGTDRRGFLRMSIGVAVGALVVGAAGRVLSQGTAAVNTARHRLRLPIHSLKPPPGVDVGVAGVASWVTPQPRFYRIDTALSVPQILPETWRMRIHGMVDKELTLTYDDLLSRGLTEAWLTLCCVSNVVGGSLISNAAFAGVRIADVLKDAGVHPGADAVKSTSADGWTAGTPLSALTDGRNAMFAVGMNGQPLEPDHGFPVRMVVPGLYGYVSGTKWVVDLEVTRFADFSAFWTERGWSARGPVKTESRIDVPTNGQNIQAGQVAIGGVAWAQHTGIRRVEVQIDDKPWATARLGVDPTIDSWRQWAYVWDAAPGEHRIRVRATDNSGYTQTPVTSGVLPNGATGWHTVTVIVS